MLRGYGNMTLSRRQVVQLEGCQQLPPQKLVCELLFGKAGRQLVSCLPCRQVVGRKACRQLGFGWHDDVKLVDNDFLVKSLFASCFWAKLGRQLVFGVLSREVGCSSTRLIHKD